MPTRSLFLCLALLPLTSFAERSSRDDNADAPPSPAEQERGMFHLPPGFEIQLVADETQIQKPMNLNFDAAGRLWVTGSEMYPWPAKLDALGQPIAGFDETWNSMSGAFDAKKAPAPRERATDSVRVLSDFGPDGRARKVEVFADGLNIPVGVMPLPRKYPQIAQISADGNSVDSSKNLRESAKSADPKGDSVIVFSIPKIWRLTDTDGDGRADLREPLYGDFGFRDTHGMSSNYLYWVDGWIYGCHGFANHSVVKDGSGNVTEMNSGNTYRFRPDGSRFEIYTHGQTNPFGLAVDDWGNFYSADSHSKPVMMLLPGGYYAGIGKTHDGLGFAPTIMDHDHGSSAIAGVAWYGAKQFPEEFYGNTFNGNPVTRRINRDRYEWHGSTPKAIEMPDFLTCDDPWFRPVQVKLGPDGALWVADFYNPIIGHYEQPLADPRRDHQHGRIWRIVWRGEKGEAAVPGVPDLAKLDAKGLIEKLGDENITTRTLATNELVGQGELQETFDAIAAWANAQHENFYSSDKSPAEKLRERRLSNVRCVYERLEILLADRLKNSDPLNRFSALSSTLGMFGDFLEGDESQLRHIGFIFDRAQTDRVWESMMSTHELRNDFTSPFVQRAVAQSIARSAEFLASPSSIVSDTIHDAREAELLRDARKTALNSVSECVKSLLMCWDYTPPEDSNLIYSLRLALGGCLKVAKGYEAASEIARFNPQVSEHVADISLGVPAADSAAFLLAHLHRTKLATPRAGEYLRHVVLHLPEEKLGELNALLQPLADAPLAQRLALADGLGQAARERGWKLPEELAAWTKRTVLAALDGGDAGSSDRAIAALREVTWAEKFAPLERIVLDPKQSGARRAAALEAVVNVGDGVGLAKRALMDASSLPLRKKAAELLGDVTRLSKGAGGGTTGGDACVTLLAALPSAPAELALSITASLAKTDADFGALLDLLEAGKASPGPLRNRLIAILVTKRGDALRARAEALTKDLPPEDARVDGVIAERVKAFGSAKVDAGKGAQVFAQQCAVCHRFHGQGGNVGPNLDGVAARGAHRLIEDILDPNRNVDPTFRQTTLELKDGRMLIGVNLREEGGAVLLTDAAGQTQSTPKETVKTQSQSRLSLMPPAFETAIPAEDFNALLGYLLR